MLYPYGAMAPVWEGTKKKKHIQMVVKYTTVPLPKKALGLIGYIIYNIHIILQYSTISILENNAHI